VTIRTVAMNWRDRIAIDPAIRGGDPCIKGIRVPVSLDVGSFADSDTAAEIIEAWPQLSEDDVKAALKFAAEAVNASVSEVSFRTGPNKLVIPAEAGIYGGHGSRPPPGRQRKK